MTAALSASSSATAASTTGSTSCLANSSHVGILHGGRYLKGIVNPVTASNVTGSVFITFQLSVNFGRVPDTNSVCGGSSTSLLTKLSVEGGGGTTIVSIRL